MPPGALYYYCDVEFALVGHLVENVARTAFEAHCEDAIFEPFRQGPGPASASPGVGVGLSLVARFAELHGGRAWVEDRPGGGASFRVLLAEA